jgi:tetratricopeptide (TPR) repeat protein
MSERSPYSLVSEIDALLERRRLAQARMRLKEALREFPQHPDLLLLAAQTDYLEDHTAEALSNVYQVLASAPDHEGARRLLFALLLETGDLVEAEQVIVALLREFPEHAPYYGSYGELMIRAMDLKKARALAEEGLKYDPEDSVCLVTRTICDLIEQPSGATSHALQQLIVRSPQAVHTLILIRAALIDRGDYRGALRISRELVRIEPGNREFIEGVQELLALTHWSMLPLWPVTRWGWAGAIGIWVVANVVLRVLAARHSDWTVLTVGLTLVFIAYVIYSWVWPPLLRRWFARA